jgi:hypothetical protein
MLAASLVAATPALAADANATVQVTGLQFSASDGLSFSWLAGSGYQALFAESREAGGLGGNQLADPAPLDSWADQALATATAHAAATAGAGVTGLLSAGASASRAVAAVQPAQPHAGNSWAMQSGWFQLSGAGQLTIVVDYQLSASAPLGDGQDSQALAGLQLQAGNLDTGSSGSDGLQLWSFELPGGSASRSGSLQLVVNITGPGQTGFYDLRANADVSAIATVPEPGGWAMLALGLATLGAMVRRQRRAG